MHQPNDINYILYGDVAYCQFLNTTIYAHLKKKKKKFASKFSVNKKKERKIV